MTNNKYKIKKLFQRDLIRKHYEGTFISRLCVKSGPKYPSDVKGLSFNLQDKNLRKSFCRKETITWR